MHRFLLWCNKICPYLQFSYSSVWVSTSSLGLVSFVIASGQRSNDFAATCGNQWEARVLIYPIESCTVYQILFWGQGCYFFTRGGDHIFQCLICRYMLRNLIYREFLQIKIMSVTRVYKIGLRLFDKEVGCMVQFYFYPSIQFDFRQNIQRYRNNVNIIYSNTFVA